MSASLELTSRVEVGVCLTGVTCHNTMTSAIPFELPLPWDDIARWRYAQPKRDCRLSTLTNGVVYRRCYEFDHPHTSTIRVARGPCIIPNEIETQLSIMQ